MLVMAQDKMELAALLDAVSNSVARLNDEKELLLSRAVGLTVSLQPGVTISNGGIPNGY